MDVDFFNQPDVLQLLKKAETDENLLAKDAEFRKNAEAKIKAYFERTSSKQKDKAKSGFKNYAIGREEWKISAQETEYLRSKYEIEIIEQLKQLQRQAKSRNNIR